MSCICWGSGAVSRARCDVAGRARPGQAPCFGGWAIGAGWGRLTRAGESGRGVGGGHGALGVGRRFADRVAAWEEAPVIHPVARGGPGCRAVLGGSIKWAAVLLDVGGSRPDIGASSPERAPRALVMRASFCELAAGRAALASSSSWWWMSGWRLRQRVLPSRSRGEQRGGGWRGVAVFGVFGPGGLGDRPQGG